MPCARTRSRAHLFSSPYLSLSSSLSLGTPRPGERARQFSKTFTLFLPLPRSAVLQRPLFSTANIASPRYSARAFNLRARTIALCPGTSSAARTARDEERGWKSDCVAAGEKERARAKSKRKTEEERTRVSAEGRGEGTVTRVGRSEKIGKATEERRRRETVRSLPSLLSARAHAV